MNQENKTNYIYSCIEALNYQFQGDYKLIFDYEINSDDEIESTIITLLNNEGLPILEVESEGFKDLKSINNHFIDLLEEVKTEILTSLEHSSTVIYKISEFDVWQSKDSERFIGAYTNRLLALLDVQISYKEILTEENGAYSSVNNLYDRNSSFDIISIEEITLNEIN